MSPYLDARLYAIGYIYLLFLCLSTFLCPFFYIYYPNLDQQPNSRISTRFHQEKVYNNNQVILTLL